MQQFSDQGATQLFSVAGSDIRFGQSDEGSPFAVASDYARTLDYSSTQKALQIIDEDEKGREYVWTWVTAEVNHAGQSAGMWQRRKQWVIYEDGMWELIFRSTLPGAKAIKKQVKAILRQIRETGRFEAPTATTSIPAGTVPWEHAAAVARSLGLRVDAHGFKELLTTGGVLTTHTGAPHRKWEHLFWPVPHARRWEVRSIVLRQLIFFAAQVQRELALAERTLQMSLPFPVDGGIVRPGFERGDAA